MKKFVVAALFAALFVSCSISENAGELNGSADVNSASNPYVQLDIAESTRTWISGYDNAVNASGTIIVENVAYNKEVIVHWQSEDGSWVDTAASYVKSLDNNLELWSFSGIGDQIYQPYFGGSASIKFALKYTVNGITSWDNNGGNDYLLYQGGAGQNPADYPATFALGAPNVKVMSSSLSSQSGYNSLYVKLGVKDLAYNKTVGIVYTADNWVTVRTAYATFQSDSSGLEQTWVVSESINANEDNVEFAAFFRENGNEHWDNNFGANYSVSVQ